MKVQQNVKTKVGELRYVFIKGEGRNSAMPGNPEHYQYVASVATAKGSALHKDFEAHIDSVWEKYKKDNGLKPASKPKSTGIRPVLDKETGEETGDVLITFKTEVTWPDGKPKEIRILDRKGSDITKAVHAAPWSIGNGSTGVLHGVAQGNDTGGSHKVSLYLNAIQLAKLVKYAGVAVDAEEIDGDDIDIEEYGAAAISDDETPEL